MEKTLRFLTKRAERMQEAISAIQKDREECAFGTVEEENHANMEEIVFRTKLDELHTLISIAQNHVDLSDKLRSSLIAAGYSENSMEDGYDEGDIEELGTLLHEFIQSMNLPGRVSVVWDEFKEGFLTGGSEMYYHQASNVASDLGVEVTMPLPMENVEAFIQDLIEISLGMKQLEPFHPCFVCEYLYNAAWNVRDEYDEEEEAGDDVVLYTGPKSAFELLFETFQLDAQSSAIDSDLRQRIGDAYADIEFEEEVSETHATYRGPLHAWNLFFETISLDAESGRIEQTLRDELKVALQAVEEICE